MGEGVSKSPELPAQEKPEETGFKEQIDELGNSKWSDTPTLADQYRSHPKLCRKSAPVVKMFQLDNPQDLEAFNQLLFLTHPPEAPRIVIQTQDQAFEGKWSILARYQKVEYKVLLATK